MKLVSIPLSAAAVALLGAALAVTAAAQAPPAGPPPAGGPPRSFPAPTNLKVLPKTLTGQQVHDIMEEWEGATGGHCSSCHTADPKRLNPNGRPMLDFADDSKPEKNTARQMYLMTLDINKNYVAKIDSSGAPVTCGTCHRGHVGPEPWVAPEEHQGPPKPGVPPAAQGTPAPEHK